jgi:hypothetical protein
VSEVELTKLHSLLGNRIYTSLTAARKQPKHKYWAAHKIAVWDQNSTCQSQLRASASPFETPDIVDNPKYFSGSAVHATSCPKMTWERRRRLADLLSLPAGELLPHGLDHLPLPCPRNTSVTALTLRVETPARTSHLSQRADQHLPRALMAFEQLDRKPAPGNPAAPTAPRSSPV